MIMPRRTYVTAAAIGLVTFWLCGKTWPGARESGVHLPVHGPPSPREPGPIVTEGQVAAYPGALVSVGTEVGGTLIELATQEKIAVRKGQVLARLDDSLKRAAL